MKTAGEIVHYLNDTGANIYRLSESFGFADNTLRNRLLKLGYEENDEGQWQYSGSPDTEPSDEDVTTKRRVKSKKRIDEGCLDETGSSSQKPSVHQALMELDLNAENVRTTISVQSDSLEGLKEFAKKTRLRISDLHTLAIHELLMKYDSDDCR